MNLPVRRVALSIVIALSARAGVAQQPSSTGRYIVTTTPVSIPNSGVKVCMGVDPTDPRGIWWWEPGRSGCSSRSTGPDVFAAWEGSVIARDQATTDIRFKVGMHVGEPLDVRLTMRDGSVLTGSGAAGTGADLGVRTERRDDLVLPFISLTHSGAAQDAIDARQAWGTVVDGLRAAIAPAGPGDVPARDDEFDAMFQNVGDQDITLNLGVGQWDARLLFPVRLRLTDSRGASQELRFDAALPTTTGRMHDLTVRLPPGATHVVRLKRTIRTASRSASRGAVPRRDRIRRRRPSAPALAAASRR